MGHKDGNIQIAITKEAVRLMGRRIDILSEAFVNPVRSGGEIDGLWWQSKTNNSDLSNLWTSKV